MNRGEWGEPYAAIRILGEKRLFLADEKGDINRKEWMDVVRISRQETQDRLVTYTLSDGDDVQISVNDSAVASIPTGLFLNMAEALKRDVIAGSGRSFGVSDDVYTFLERAEIRHMKARSIEKSDIVLDARDPRTSIVRTDIGFSIKCEFGEAPTLFNTGRASAVKYRINGMTQELMEEINSLVDSKGHASVSARCQALMDSNCTLEYAGYEYANRAKCCAFQENLELINPVLPHVIERMLWYHFMENCTEVGVDAVTKKIISENPCGISMPEIKYEYMVKMFLYSAYCGMTAGTVWDGKSTVKGGYITVKENGDVVANYAVESEAFKYFLYTHCYLDFPSTDYKHGDYGAVYEENGEYYFKLNFQVRIR